MGNKTKKVEIEIPVGKVAKWVDGVLTLVDEKPQDVTERIKTFADACRELGSDHPFVKAYDGYTSHIHQHDMDDHDLVAYLQLRIITEALNEGWRPQFKKCERRWYFWYNLITKEEYDKLSAEDKSRVVGRGGNNVNAYFGLVYADTVSFMRTRFTHLRTRSRASVLGSPSKAKNSQPTQVGSSPRFMPTSVSNQSRRRRKNKAGVVRRQQPPHCHFSNKQIFYHNEKVQRNKSRVGRADERV